MVRLAGVGLVLLAGVALFVGAGIYGLVLAAAWSVLFALAWAESGLQTSRPRRLVVDLALVGTCILGGWEGGWLLLPGAIAFALADQIDPAPTARRSLGRGAPAALRLFSGLLMLGFGALYLFAPAFRAIDSATGAAAATSFFGRPGQTLAPYGLVLLSLAEALVLMSLFFPDSSRVRHVLAVAICLLAAGAALTGSGAILFILPLLCAGLAWQLLGPPARAS